MHEDQTTQLVNRLREAKHFGTNDPYLFDEAADELQRLKKALFRNAESERERRRNRARTAAASAIFTFFSVLAAFILLHAVGGTEWHLVGLFAVFLSPIVGALMPGAID